MFWLLQTRPAPRFYDIFPVEFEDGTVLNEADVFVPVYTTWMNGSHTPMSPASGAYWKADGTFVEGTEVRAGTWCSSRV